MGNTRSFPGLPSGELKLKSGDRNDHIPYPFAGTKSYGGIFADIEFKEFVIQNLQSSLLVTSILQNSSDESIIVDGIRYFQYNSPESRKAIIADITKFHQFTSAGIKGQLSDTLKLSGKEVELHQDTTCSPFLRSFQCRLAAVRAMEKSVALERKVTKRCFQPRVVSDATLNSREHPHLSLVCPLMMSGISLVEILPLCLPAATRAGNAEPLLQPFNTILESLCNCSDLYLFSCWAPPPRLPLKTVPLSSHSVSSSTSPEHASSAATDGAHEFWSCPSSGGVWMARLTTAADIRFLAMSWGPLLKHGVSSVCFAPKQISVFVRRQDPKGSPLELLTTINVDEELKKQNTSRHQYSLPGATNVIEVMLQMSGISQGNKGSENVVKLFGVDILADDTATVWVDMLDVMKRMQKSLWTIRGLDTLGPQMYSGLLNSARITGSLSIILDLVSHIHKDGLERVFEKEKYASILCGLLQAIRDEDLMIRETLENSSTETADKVLQGIRFDESAKSAELCISGEGLLLGGTAAGNTYGLLSCEMDSGVWEWEVMITKDTRGDETSCLGVAKKPVTDCRYDSSADMWLVRCYNGDTYHGGRRPRNKTIPHIHPEDVCRFTFDADSQTLSLAVNDLEVGVIFENVSRGVSPAVAFYGGGKEVKLLGIKKLGTTRSTEKISMKDLMPLMKLPEPQEFQRGEQGVCSSLLRVVANITSSRVLALEHGVSSKHVTSLKSASMQVLEHPYCIEVSEEVFKRIFDLLEMFMSIKQKTESSDSVIVYLLRILNGQFACLIISEVDPTEVGLGSGESACPLIERGHNLLKSLMEGSCAVEVRKAAAESFSRGIPLFLGTVDEKVRSAIRLIDSVFVSQDHIDPSKCIVLKTIMKTISTCSEVVSILEFCREGKSSREVVSVLIRKCLFLSKEMFVSPDMHQDCAEIDAVIIRYAHDFLSKFQEQLVLDLSVDTEGTKESAWGLALLVEYCQDLCYYSGEVLRQGHVCEKGEIDNEESLVAMVKTERRLRSSMVCLHLLPLVHALCFCLQHLSAVRAFSPYFVRLYLNVSCLVSKSASCITAQTLVSNSLRRVYQKPSFVEDADTGWRRVAGAHFEEADSTFGVSEEGMLYTSVNSSNTCAVVTSGFSGSVRAAWEFKLEADSTDDECAVFGAAHMPISNRSYSASADLYMRRAYNGYLYNRGRTAGVTMSKIHTGDTVRVEYDGRAGTISFGVNGGDQEVAFTEVSGEIYPCCGSYRNNVRIRLMKVEVYGSKTEIDDDLRSPDVVNWLSDSSLLCNKDPSMLVMIGEGPKKTETPTASSVTWLTCRGDRGVSEGTHSWSIDVVGQTEGALLAMGVVMGGNPYCSDMLASPCTADINEAPTPTARAGTGIAIPPLILTTPRNRGMSTTSVEVDGNEPMSEREREILGMQSVDSESLRIDTEDSMIMTALSSSRDDTLLELPPLSIQIESVPSVDLPLTRPMLSRTSTPAEAPGLQRHGRSNSPNTSPIISPYHGVFDFNIDIDDLEDLAQQYVATPPAPALGGESKLYNYEKSGIEAMSWCSDGSLWINGEKRGENFGEQFLPFTKTSTVSIQINMDAKTVEYFVNGEYVGVAFGPEGSEAAVVYRFRDSFSRDSCNDEYFPAASISNQYQSLRIRASGFNGSTILPTTLFTQKTLASVIGRFSASLLAGPRIDKNEVDLSSWMQSPLLSGGLEQQACHDNGDDCENDFLEDTWEDGWLKSKVYVPDGGSPWGSEKHSPRFKTDAHRTTHYRRGSQTLSNAEFLNALATAHTHESMGERSAHADEVNADIQNLLLWLDDINPDPPFLRNGLIRSGTYKFPRCENPFIACMIKHSSLLPEARSICNVLRDEGYENMKGRPGTVPSATMAAMWTKVKQLRSTLRRQRQYFLSNPVAELGGIEFDPKQMDESLEEFGKRFAGVLWTTIQNVSLKRIIELSKGPIAVTTNVVKMGINYDDEILYVKASRDIPSAESNDLIFIMEQVNSQKVELLFNGVPVQCTELIRPSNPRYADTCVYEFQLHKFFDEEIFELTTETISKFDVVFKLGKGGCILLSPDSETMKQPKSIKTASMIPSVVYESDRDGSRPETFEEFCATIIQRATFLMSILPSSEPEDVKRNSTSAPQPGIESLRSDVLHASSPSSSRWLSDDTTDGWKNVTDVLRVRNRMRKELSRDSLASINSVDEKNEDIKDPIYLESTIYEDIIPGLDLEGSEVSVEPTEAPSSLPLKVMQECALFITTSDEDHELSLSALTEVLKRRYERAFYRSFGMQLLNVVLSTPDVAGDPFSVEELLLFLRSSLCMGSIASSAGEDMSIEYAAPDAHYLSNLEGCSFESMNAVQSSFLNLYTTISSLLQNFVKAWTSSTKAVAVIDSKPPIEHEVSVQVEVPRSVLGAIFSMLSCWNLHFSGRDHHFLMECSLLPTLHKLVDLETYENAVSNWMEVASRRIELLSLSSKHRDDGEVTEREWKLWDSTYVQTGLQSGRISCRALLYHICQAPDDLFDPDEKKNLNFPSEDKPFEEVCSGYTISQLSLMYEKMLSVCRRREESRQKQVAKAQAAFFEAKAKEEEALCNKLHSMGVPMFDRSNMSSEVVLEDSDRVAGIRNLQASYKVASIFANVSYNFAAAEREMTGNYFEVTILEAGLKDIGIGLAAQGIFPVSGEMPGWEAHSYGYHGDDGRRFGTRNTDAMWPTWTTGDVIGCGFDAAARSIFFTYNGTMLGDGFTEVEDDVLRPVVSFHSPNVLQRVRINFGTSAFIYEGEEVHAHPAAAAFADMEAQLSPSQVISDLSPSMNLTAEKVLQMSEDCVVKLLESYNESAIGNISDLRVRLLAANANSVDRYRRINLPEEKEELEMCETKDEIDRAAVSKELAELDSVLEAATSHINELINLRNYAWALIRFVLTTSCATDPNGEVRKTRSKLLRPRGASEDFFDAMPDDSLLLSSTKSTFGTPTSLTIVDSLKLQELIVAKSMHQVCLGAQYFEVAAFGGQEVGFILSSLPVKSSSLASSPTRSTEKVVPPGSSVSLEMCEIDGIIEKHLFAINALLMHSSSMLDQISTPQNIKALLTLRKIGSPRLQRLVINILTPCLPSITPEVADMSFNNGQDEEKKPSPPAGKRILPDRIVLSLLSRVKTAVAVPSENTWRNFLDSQWVPNESMLTGTHYIPLGYGQLVLWEAGHVVGLLQRLFESPHWMEVVSCCLTDTIRSATKVIKKVNAESEEGRGFDLDREDCETLQMASAACVIFSDVGSLCPGALIMDETGRVGRVVYKQQGDEEVNVVFSDPEAGDNAFSCDAIVSVPIRSIHSIAEGLNLDFAILSQPIVVELMKLLSESLSWFKNNSDMGSSNQSFVSSQLHRLCALLTTSLSVVLETQGDFVMDSCRDAGLDLKEIFENAVTPIKLPHLPSLNDLCRMRLFCQARILESGVGCISNTVTGSNEKSPEQSDVSGSVAVSRNISTTSDWKDGCSVPTADDDMSDNDDAATGMAVSGILSFDSKSRNARRRIAVELADETSLPVAMCLSRLEFFGGDRSQALQSLHEDSAIRDFEPMPMSTVSFSDEHVVRHCDFDVSDTGRPSSETIACGFRAPYACTVSKLSNSTKNTTGASSSNPASEQAPPLELNVGNIICGIDDEGALIESNFHLELCMSTGLSENIITMFCDYDLGVDLYHGMRRTDSCVVSHLYETKLEDFPELLLTLDITLTIIRLRQVASKMISERSINLQRDAGGKEQWLSLLKYIMRAEIMSAGESKDFGKLLCGICDSVMSSPPGVPTGNHVNALRSLMVEDVYWNLDMLMESSTLSCPRSQERLELDNMAGKGIFCSSTHPFVTDHTSTFDMPIPLEWRGAQVICDLRNASYGSGCDVSLYCSKEEQPRYIFHGNPRDSKLEPQNRFTSHYIPGARDMTIKVDYKIPKPYVSFESKTLEINGVKQEFDVADCVAVSGESFFFEAICSRTTQDEMRFGIFENSDPFVNAKSIAFNSMGDIFVNGISQNATLFESPGSDALSLHERVFLHDLKKWGIVRYFGKTQFADGTWVGVELEEEIGDNDGTVEGHQYFECKPQHGVFVLESNCSKREWETGDTLGCMLQVEADKTKVWFARNGVWSAVYALEYPALCVQPFFARVAVSDEFKLNFGDVALTHPPPDTLDTGCPEWSLFSRHAEKRTAECREKNWGYQLYIKPLEKLAYVVARDFDLIASSVEQEITHNGKSTVVTLYFWRPKKIAGYKSCGDIVTRENRPPRGAVVVHADHCTSIKKYTKAFFAPKHDFTVWRPLPSEGFAALGDVVTSGSSKPSASACAAVPLWALKECGIGGWIFKTKSKSTASGKGTSLCSIWDVNSLMGYFVGSASDRRDFSRKSSDGTVNNVIGYTFSCELSHVIAGEWSIDIDSPSLMWTIHLLDFLLDHPQCRDHVLTKTMFTALIRFMTSKYSPDGIAVVPVLIKMVRYSMEFGVTIGVDTMRPICKLILSTAYTKCKSELKGGQLPGAMLTLVDLVCEATSHRGSSIFRHAIKTVPFDASISAAFLDIYYERIARQEQQSLMWYDRKTTPFHLQFARLVLPPSDEYALSGKTHALLQLCSIKRFLQYLSFDSPDCSGVNSDLLPPELVLSSWYKFLKACKLEESAHPYDDSTPQKYSKVISFPGARSISVTIDKRSSLGPNAVLKLSSGSDFSMTLSGVDFGEKRHKSIQVLGSELTLEFEVNVPEEGPSPAVTPLVNPLAEDFWGWSIVVSGEGEVYEEVSASIDLQACVCGELSVPIAHDATRSSPVPTICGEENTDQKLGECKVENVEEGSHLTCDDVLRVRNRGVVGAAGTLKVPHAHGLKVSVKWKIPSAMSSDSQIAKKHSFVLELIPQEDSRDISHLFLVGKDSELEHLVGGSIVDYKLYVVDKIDGDTGAIAARKVEKDEAGIRDAEAESKPAEPEETTPVRQHWDCSACTYINQPSFTVCEICGTPDLTAVGSTSVDERAAEGDVVQATATAAGQDESPPNFAVWICSGCTWNNRLDLTNCEMCQSSRELPEAPALREQSSAGSAVDADQDPPVSTPARVEGGPLEELGAPPPVPLRSRLRTLSDFDMRMGRSRSNTFESATGRSRSNTLESGAGASVGTAGSIHPLDCVEVLVISAEGVFSATERLETLLTQAVVNGNWTPIHLKSAMSRWTRQADDCLLEYFNANPGAEKLATHPLQWSLPQKYMTYSSFSLSDYNLLEIQSRSLMLCLLNSSIKNILPIIDIANPDPYSLGALIRRMNKYIMIHVKQPMLQRSIDATMSSGAGLPAVVNLDNFKAILSVDRGEMDPAESQNCFVQAFHQLSKHDSKVYRFIFNSDRVFQMHFEGESGIDAGGVFREGVTRMVEDLFDTKNFNLLVLCPNGQNEVHMNIDKCLPNPSHTSPLAMQMMEFVGKVMAMSIRAKLALPFSFPSLVWKKILREEVTTDDLRAIDVITCSLLEAVRFCENDGISNQELFGEKYGDKLRFTYTGCDGVERELFEGGKDVIVEFDTREAYCDQVLEKRLSECDRHIEAIITGMEGVIQMQVIQLFSWSQLEVLVGGNPVFDIEVWKAHTESSIPPRNLEMFWNVIESLTPKEQEGFVRFAWGRSRLPPAKEFTVKMKLVSRGTEILPVAHTCFFSIELPNYKTEEEMRHGLLTAIHFGATGILMG